MNEAAKFEMYKKKLDGVCEENSLVYRFRRDIYPITLTIRPASGIAEQMDLLASAEGNGYTSPDAAIVFAYRDGDIAYKMSNTFTIDDALFSRIKNLFKKLHFYWLQYFHRDLMEKQLLSASSMPEEDDTDDEDEERGETQKHGELNAMPGSIAEATRIVRAENKASVALLQRRMNIGYSEASNLIDELEERGIIGPFAGPAPREVLPFDEPDDAAALEVEV